MTQEYIVNDIVMYDNKVMVVKEPRDGNHFDLYCPKERLVYCLVDIDEIKPVSLTPEILEKNEWKRNGGQYSFTFKPYVGDKVEYIGFFIEMFKDVHDMLKYRYFQITHENKVIYGCFYVHEIQHLLFGLGINLEMEV
jgi:hypothetical protein|nr:MAG TPA: hypothetical protein [Caudoviricetes sp.]